MSDYKELEYKYKADHVKLTVFDQLMQKLNPEKIKEVSSWDHYYVSKHNEEWAMRFRQSADKPELTIKRKTSNLNNQDRIEINLELAPGTSEAKVRAFSDLLDHNFNFNVYKSCFIYYFDYVDIVYYIVYNSDMVEQGRFIEVEFLEDKLKGLTEEQAFDTLKQYEAHLSVLGITPQNRMKKSLYEMFKR